MNALTRSLSVFLLLCATVSPTQSQTWYQVELIIFAQDHPELYSQGATDEQWPEDLTPSWPQPLLKLESPLSPSPALRPLPQNQRKMNNDAYALRVTDGYQLLWHQAWQQPMLPENQAPWIQITGGQQFGDRYELEGAIRVHLERFLHLTLDLWDSEFELVPTPDENMSAEAPLFSLPKRQQIPPACYFYRHSWPRSITIEQPRMDPGFVVQDWWFAPFGCDWPTPQSQTGLTQSPAYNPYIQIELPVATYEIIGRPGLYTNRATFGGPTYLEQRETLPSILPAEEASPSEEASAHEKWRASQIIPFRQSRRMRSEELHYLDHPKLGALILITPIEAPVISLEEFLQQQQ